MFRTVLTSLLAVLVLCGSAFAAEKTLIAAANRSNSVYAPTASRRDSDNGVLARVSATDTTPEVVYRRGGDDNVLVEYGPMTLDLGLRMRIYALMQSLTERAPAGLIDQTPGVRSLHLHFDPAILPTPKCWF